ncbi:hypothetical protein ATANTOWER_029376 [Ataeniobius toweri]|uniref:Secreted protein n=1 Tax=Ataeniobius toweri TaxID=208326 RepID=A0ABU7B016_9TELE|nr:hypothetical protein [Ataeniobius toweri]
MAGYALVWTAAGGACGLVAAASWGFCTVAASWLPWGSPLLLSGGFVIVPAVVHTGFTCLGGLWMSVARISVCGSSHILLHYIHKCAHTYTHRCLDSGVNRYTDVLY